MNASDPASALGPTPLRDRVAVITGASRGIGAEIALAFASAGADVALAARGGERLAAVAGQVEDLGRRALPVPTDVTDSAQADRLIDTVVGTLGRLDVLVNNSGVVHGTSLLDTTDDDWDRVIATNLRGTFLCTRAAGRHLVPARAGKVINMASNFAFTGIAGHGAYCASKGAIVAFTRAMAVEWAPYDIQVNALAPGYVATELNAAARADPELSARIVRQIPARRMGEPAEIAPWAVLLASSVSDFMTGETIVIDGGQLAR